ncbi:uncharacterized protein LOC110846701 isoform X2 [Folsomia candida]|nr:uncharacterized protein LOC110846701 isoform X2 [Folsomia candida]
MKKLPRLYSQTMKRSTDAQIPPDSNNVEQIAGPSDTAGEESLTEEDLAVQKDWEGDCFSRHWKKCAGLDHILVMNVYNKTNGRDYETLHWEMDCKLSSVVCMKNGWSVNQCQIICMSKCNKAMLQGYDSFVSYSGPCKYI